MKTFRHGYQSLSFNCPSELPAFCSVFFDKPFREKLISKAVREAGSKHELGRILSYYGRSTHKNIHDITLGKRGIRMDRLKKLSRLTHTSLTSMSSHIVKIIIGKKQFLPLSL